MPDPSVPSRQTVITDAPADTTSAAPLPTVPTEKYAVEGEVGRGGLGRVLRAVDRAMGRAVAVKEVLGSDPETERRFVREALITSRIEHPAIVPVYEAGRWPDGKPFYTMKLISGQPLTVLARGQRSPRERLALLPHVITVADAIAYAHSRGVIHRDIKPDNVIVGQFGETVVIDWGIAVELLENGQHAEPRADGEEPQVLGTPAFMAPEQARGEPVDARADIYALGGLLYFISSGTWAGGRIDDTSDDESARPLTAATADTMTARSMVRASGPVLVPLDVRRPDTPSELVAIVRKAMAPDRRARYASALEFAEDLKRFQTGQLVGAHKYSVWSLIGRWARRHRTLVAVAAATLVAVALSGAASVTRVVRAQHLAEAQRSVADGQRRRAESARLLAEKRSNDLVLLQARAALQTDPTAALAWIKRYPPTAAGWREVPALASDALSRGVSRDVWHMSRSSAEGISFSPDGRWLAAGSADRLVRLWSPSTGVVHALPGHSGPVNDVEFSPDGHLLASCSYDHTVRLWKLDGDGGASGPRLLGRHDSSVLDVAFSPDSRWVATAGKDNSVRLWNVVSGETRVLHGHSLAVWAVAFSPDGRTLASASRDKTVRLWDLATGKARVIRSPEVIFQLAFGADGRTVVGSSEATIERWALADGSRHPLPKIHSVIEGVTMAPSGQLIAFGGADGIVRVWDERTGQTQSLVGHSGNIEFVRFAPDGASLASSSQDGTVRIWRITPRPDRVLPGPDAGAERLAFAPDGSELIASGADGSLRRWRLADGQMQLLRAHHGGAIEVVYLPGGHQILSISRNDRTVRLWDLERGTSRVLDTHASGQGVALSRDGHTVAWAEGNERATVYDLASGRVRCRFQGSDLGFLALSADGGRLAYANGHDIHLAHIADCADRAIYTHEAGLNAVLFSRDDRLLASADVDRGLRLFDVASGQVRALVGHEMEIYALAFSRDGRRLASVSEDHTARVWDVASGKTERIFRGHELGVTSVAFTPDGSTLATAGPDHTVRLWSLSDDRVRILRGHEDTIHDLVISPDGKLIASASADTTVRLWSSELPPSVPSEPAGLRAWLEQTTSAEIDTGQSLQSPTRPRD